MHRTLTFTQEIILLAKLNSAQGQEHTFVRMYKTFFCKGDRFNWEAERLRERQGPKVSSLGALHFRFYSQRSLNREKKAFSQVCLYNRAIAVRERARGTKRDAKAASQNGEDRDMHTHLFAT